jgi:hypothetical protein
MHNNYVPIRIAYIRKQNWIKIDKMKYCEITYNDKKYLLVRKSKKYLIKLNHKIVYGKIYLIFSNRFDLYRCSSKSDISEHHQIYENYDRIIFI